MPPTRPDAARSCCARKLACRGDPQGPRGDRLHRDAVPGQQGEDCRAHRRDACAKSSIEGIADLRDESDRDGVRVVVELKRDAEPDIVLNQLYRHTALQTSFGVNMLALNGGRPELMTLRDIIAAFIAFREEVITRRTSYLLGKARERAHILVGLLVAVANIDEIIALIRAAPDPATARAGLRRRGAGRQAMSRRWWRWSASPAARSPRTAPISLSDEQARAILDLRLQRLTGLERDKIAEELRGADHRDRRLSRNPALARAADRGVARRAAGDQGAVREPAPHRDRGCRVRGRHRGADPARGRWSSPSAMPATSSGCRCRPIARSAAAGAAAPAWRSARRISSARSLSPRPSTPVLFFTSSGRVYKLKVYRLPLGTPQARGRPMVNLLPNLTEGETISTVMPLPEDEESWGELTVMFATADGYVRRNALSDFVDVRANGKIAMKFEGEDADDRLIAVATCTDANDVLLATRNGKAIRFPIGDVRVFAGRSSVGVRGIRLLGDDQVISMSILRHEEVAPEMRNAYLEPRRASGAARIGEESERQRRRPRRARGRGERREPARRRSRRSSSPTSRSARNSC